MSPSEEALERMLRDENAEREKARKLAMALVPTSHRLKCHTHWMNEIVSGRKNFDVRSTADRVFQAGDTLELFYWDTSPTATQCQPIHQAPNSGYFVRVKAVYHGLPGVDPGYCVLAIESMDRDLP